MTDLLGPGDAGAPRTLPYTDSTVVAELTYPNSADTYFGDCVSSTPGTGTPIVAKFLNRLSQQIRRVIRNAGVTQNNADDDMLWKAITTAPPGRLLGIQKFLVAGTSTYTPTAGTAAVIVEVQGAGGSGGGAGTTDASHVIVGSGGGAGAYAKGRFTSAFSGVTVTVGAAGPGSAGGFGVTGGSSSFGALVSCPGGTGGSKAGPVTPPWATGAGQTGSPSGGNIVSAQGAGGGISYAISLAQGWGALGGASAFGGGGGPQPAGVAGSAAGAPGSGGGGSCNCASAGSAIAGGNGADGMVIVWEFA